MRYWVGIVKLLFGPIAIAITLGATPGARAADRSIASVVAQVPGVEGDWQKYLPPLPRIEMAPAVDGRKFPRLWQGTVRWEPSHRFTRYAVTAGLAAASEHHYNFQIIPQPPAAQARGEGALADGYYLLRAVLLRPNLENADSGGSPVSEPERALAMYERFITSFEDVVKMSEGVIRAPVVLKIPFASATTVRNVLLLQILPLDQSRLVLDRSGLIARGSRFEVLKDSAAKLGVIKIAFVPRFSSGLATPPPPTRAEMISDEEALDLGPFAKTASDYQKRRLSLELAPWTAEKWAKKIDAQVMGEREWHSALAPLSFSRTVGQASHPSIATLMAELDDREGRLDERLAISFCSLLASGSLPDPRLRLKSRDIEIHQQSRFLNCVLQPQRNFQLSHVTFVESVDQTTREHVAGGSLRHSLSANFLANRSRSVDVFFNLTSSLSLLDAFGYLKLGGNYAVNRTYTRSQAEGAVFSGAIDLEMNFWDLNLRLQRYRSCLLLEALQELKARYLLCDETRNHPKQVIERYYHVFTTPSTAPTIDAFDPRNQWVNMSFRGVRDYVLFHQAVTANLTPNHDLEKTALDDLRVSAQAYARVRGTEPGLLVRRVPLVGPRSEEFERRVKNPSLWDRLFGRYSEKFN